MLGDNWIKYFGSILPRLKISRYILRSTIVIVVCREQLVTFANRLVSVFLACR